MLSCCICSSLFYIRFSFRNYVGTRFLRPIPTVYIFTPKFASKYDGDAQGWVGIGSVSGVEVTTLAALVN